MNRADLRTVRLADVLIPSSDRHKVEITKDYPNLGLYSFGRGTFPKPPISGASTSAPALFKVRSGQFIYSRLFAFEGAFAIVPKEMDGRFVSNEYPTFDIDATKVLPEYLRTVICRPAAWKEMADLTVGIGHRRQRLQPQQLLSYEIEVPPLSEQERIVEVLGTVDTALSCARKVREDAESFMRALRESLLVENGDWRSCENWGVVSLEDICDVTLGFTKGRKLVGETCELPYLRAANVQDGFIVTDDVSRIEACSADVLKYSLKRDDVLLLEGGNLEHIGRAWIWDGSIESCLHQNSVIRARVRDENRSDPRFVAWALGASPARNFCIDEGSQTSNVAHLGLSGARAIMLPLPPHEEQMMIVRQLDTVRDQLVESTKKVLNYIEFREKLIEALISGSQKLYDWDALELDLVSGEMIA